MLVEGRHESTPSECWSVTHTADGDTVREEFATIELAASRLLELNIADDEIDEALIEMYSLGHVRAIFMDAKFDHSQDY